MSILDQRSSGVLFHPTCFPGKRDAVGTLGKEAYRFIDWLAAAGQKLWQILPLNPTGYGDSPYASFSAFAGNPYMIDLEELAAEGDLSADELQDYSPPSGSAGRVDFGWLYENKFPLLYRAYHNFRKQSSPVRSRLFKRFCEENSFWLENYALFMGVKAGREGRPWSEWPLELRCGGGYEQLQDHFTYEDYEFQKYVQWVFYTQWRSLKEYANERGVQIIGDAPIFVAYDSADVWANQELFFLDENGSPTVVAGVPPDYFSATGQLWGNPLYNWEKMAANGYTWWMERIRHLLTLVDVIRIDHFRGFAQYWEVPAGEETAINGEWVDGPGDSFFKAVEEQLGEELPIIAEDLGLISPDVEKLRDDFRLPGMKIFEFAPWGEETFEREGARFEFKVHSYLPENYPRRSVVYPGTHDNETFAGWYERLSDHARQHLCDYLGATSYDIGEIRWMVLQRIWHSDANQAVVSLQDLLGLGDEARLNTPGSCGPENWSWRLPEMAQIETGEIQVRFADLTVDAGRISY